MEEPTRRTRRTGTPPQPTHKVEYTAALDGGGTGRITQNLTQAALAALLTKPGITLIAVNREPPVFYGRKKHR